MLASISLLVIIFSYLVYRIDRPYRVEKILDGETVLLTGGEKAKLLGVDLKGNDENASMSAEYLKALLDSRNIWIERSFYDRKTDGRSYVWMWVGCESAPKLLLSELIGKDENPIGCKKGVLVNEQIVKMGWSEVVFPEGKKTGRYTIRMTDQGK